LQTVKTVEKITIRDQEFSKKIINKGITPLERCYQCYACSDACPMAFVMDYYPNQLIHMVRLGLKEKVLSSKTIWVCVSCWTCVTRCPNEIDIVRFMDVLRVESLKGGFKSPVNEIPKFHKVFLEEVHKKGRISELELLFRYKLKTCGFFSLKKLREDISLGLKMFLKGKLKPYAPVVVCQKAVEEVFTKVQWSKGRQ